MRTLRMALVFAVTAALAAPLPRAVAGDQCVPVQVPGIGEACRLANGLLEMRTPRTGDLLGYTHGPDATASVHSARATAPVVPQRRAICATSTEYHVELVYARAKDDTDRFASLKPSFLAAFEQANYVLNTASLETGPDGADYRVLCSGGAVTVSNAVLPTSKASDSFSSIVTDLRGLGYTNARAKYLVLYDEIVTSGVAGTAQIYADDALSSANRNLRGGMFAVSYVMAWKTMMHELSHTMGAVQHSAPHSTKGYHCTDGYDVMCYADGGSQGSSYSTSSCPSGMVFDCRKDDYFNSHPKSGTYLATRWNLGSRLNTYIRFMPPEDVTAPAVGIVEPRSGYRYTDGCVNKSSTGSSRPQFRGKGCVHANVTDNKTGVDRLEIFFDGRLISTQRTFPMAALTFDLGRGTGTGVPLKLVAYDKAQTPNVSTVTVLVDIV